MVKTCIDRPIAGIYVDEATGMLFGLDVNADEQIVKFPCNWREVFRNHRVIHK